jgi:hypothetical protein
MRYLVTSEFMLVVSDIKESLSYELSLSPGTQRGSTRSASRSACVSGARGMPGADVEAEAEADVEADVEACWCSEAPCAARDVPPGSSPSPRSSMMLGAWQSAEPMQLGFDGFGNVANPSAQMVLRKLENVERPFDPAVGDVWLMP